MTKNTVVIECGAERRECPLDALKIGSEKIQRAFKTPMDGLEVDLLTVICCAAFADREFLRPKDEWARELLLTIPVSEPPIWEDAKVSEALLQCLCFATGDSWQIQFRKLIGPSLPHPTLVSNLPSGIKPAGIILYSGGVDSAATLFQWLQENPGKEPLPIGIDSSSQVGSQIRAALGTDRGSVVKFSVKFPQNGKKESTYRTRSLVFMAAGAISARLAGLSEVIVSENGQGSVGPSLVPFGDEHPYVNNSPLLGHQFRLFLDQLWTSARISFRYPNVWKTKGTILRECHGLQHASDWTRHPSCSRIVRNTGQPCGICGNCLLRQVAIASCEDLELSDNLAYQWSTESALEQFSRVEREVATYAVMGMGALAKLAQQDPARIVARNALTLAEALACEFGAAYSNLQGLIREHAREWRNFTSHLHASSWILKLDEVAE